MRDFEYQEFRDEDAPQPGDILPHFETPTGGERTVLEHHLERVRRTIHNLQAIREQRPLTIYELAEYRGACEIETQLLGERGRASGGNVPNTSADPEPEARWYEPGAAGAAEFVADHRAWSARQPLDREPRPENFTEPETFADVHRAWEYRQLERVREQFRRNQDVFGGVPGVGTIDRAVADGQPRVAPADNAERLIRGLLKPSALLSGPKSCRHCGEERAHFLSGHAGLVPRACHCDRPRTGHLDRNTLAMDLLELDWQAEGLTFAGELKAENARRKAGNGQG